jgi:hypothetical protein
MPSSPGSYKPRLYQSFALKWLATRPKAALFLDVGLGKSSICLLDMATSLATGEVNRWLIVAPLRVCQTTWPSELEKWSFARGLTVLNMSGPQKDRAALSDSALKHQITVINVENLTKLIRHFKSDWPFDGVVIDESSKFKDSSTQRWRALRTVTKYIDRIRLLTGSPCAQNLMNLWSQVYLLDRGQRLGYTLGGFKQTYFRQVDWHGYEWEPVEGARDRIMEKVSDVCLVIRATGEHDPIFNRIDVMLDLDSLKAYKQLERDFFLEVSEDEGITALNAATLTNKLSQIANGFAFYEDEHGDRRVEYFHQHKIKAVEEFADETGHPFIMGYHYQPDRDRLLKHFGSRIEVFDGSKTQLQRWGKGHFQILALHPQSGGHGVDGLQHHTCTVLWYSPPWSREQFDQLNGRVTGTRQKGTPFENTQAVVNILVSRGTIDEIAYQVLSTRGDEQDAFLNLLRDKAQLLLRRSQP